MTLFLFLFYNILNNVKLKTETNEHIFGQNVGQVSVMILSKHLKLLR